MYNGCNWVGTFYLLWVPAWFRNAFHMFLIRQYMLTIPIAFDEVAKIDGASNFRILWQVVVPPCRPPIVLFFLAQRYFVRGMQLSGLAGR